MNASENRRKVQALDLIVVTFNREDTVGLTLESVSHLDFNKVICVDHYSRDRTIEIVKRFFPDCLVLQESKGIGYARTIGLRHVESPFFLFLDSDIILPRNFLEMVSKFMSPKVGAIQGKRSLHHEFWGSVIRSRVGGQSYRVLKPGDRPFTGATLVRTECARGADLSRYKMWEDYFLMKYIQGKGYSWLEVFVPVTTVEPLTVAYGGISTKTKENEGAAMRLYGIKTPGAFFIEQLKFTLRDLFFAIRLGRTKWILYVIALHASYVKGYVAPNGHLP